MCIQSEIKCDAHVKAYVTHKAQLELLGKMNTMYWEMERELVKKEWDAKMDRWNNMQRDWLAGDTPDAAF